MPLRAQITLLVTVAILLIGGGTLTVGLVQRHVDAERLSNIAIALQRSLWENLVAARAAQLDLTAANLSVRLAADAPQMTRDSVARVLDASPDLLAEGLTVEVVNLDNDLIAANAPLFRSRPLIDRRNIAALRAGRERLGGLRQESPERFVVAAIRPIRVGDEIVAAISVAVDAQTLLDNMAADIGEPAFLLSPRGRLTAGTDAALWGAAEAVLPPRPDDAQFADFAGGSYFVAPMSVADLGGGNAGKLVTLRDVTAERQHAREVERFGLMTVAFAGLVIVIGLYLLLRHAFLPLEDAVGALDALSRGDVPRPIDRAGAGEIGRIADAISVFRRNTQRLTEQEESIQRQRRRQERVIRRELERLAGLLDPEGRAEVLEDLAAVLPVLPDSSNAQNAELATLAELLERMSKRIADQHRRLTALIKELQDAIVTRTRLAALEQELDIARDLQRTFLPQPLPPQPAFEVFGLMESAKEVGGDFFDTFLIDDNRLGIVVADVSGKGVPAALFMAISRTLIKATALSSASPAHTVSEVNSFLAADNEQMMFVTLFHGVLDIASGVFTYVNAGHNRPYLMTGGALSTLPRAHGPAIAVMEDIRYGEDTVALAPGDALFLFTDGVTEAFDTAEEAFGEERLEAVLSAAHGLSAEALCRTVHEAVVRFEDGTDQADDITCFALKMRERDAS
ncbi:MAG: hypothetical protein AcusKO_21820 [Acuticoccus sp.]